MIGFYDYTVILTYISLLSAMTGIGFCLNGHPYLTIMCLLFCGLCDMFDGRIARRKKNRTEAQKSFGVQIDSLSDIVAFGVLPAVLTIKLCRGHAYAIAIAAFYTLAGLIRLAYYNVTQEETAGADGCCRSYKGLPITTAALIFPILTCFAVLFEDLWAVRLTYCIVMALTGLCFLLPIKIRKPNNKELWFILGLGVLVAIVLSIFCVKYLPMLGAKR